MLLLVLTDRPRPMAVQRSAIIPPTVRSLLQPGCGPREGEPTAIRKTSLANDRQDLIIDEISTNP